MNFKHLLFTSAFLCVPVALFAGSNPKATGSFTFITNIDNHTTATVTLVAQQLDSAYQGRGNLVLQDVAGIAYMDVKYVHVDGQFAYIASQVAEGSNYVGAPVGTWYVNVVFDGGEPAVGHDTIMGAAFPATTDPATVLGWIKNENAPWQTGALPITSGNIQVHN